MALNWQELQMKMIKFKSKDDYYPPEILISIRVDFILSMREFNYKKLVQSELFKRVQKPFQITGKPVEYDYIKEVNAIEIDAKSTNITLTNGNNYTALLSIEEIEELINNA